MLLAKMIMYIRSDRNVYGILELYMPFLCFDIAIKYRPLLPSCLHIGIDIGKVHISQSLSISKPKSSTVQDNCLFLLYFTKVN